MNLDEFGSATGILDELLPEAYDIFGEQLGGPAKTFAARAVDLAEGLRRLGVREPAVLSAVHHLGLERRR